MRNVRISYVCGFPVPLCERDERSPDPLRLNTRVKMLLHASLEIHVWLTENLHVICVIII